MAWHLSQSKSCKSLQKVMNLCAMSTPQDAASPISSCPLPPHWPLRHSQNLERKAPFRRWIFAIPSACVPFHTEMRGSPSHLLQISGSQDPALGQFSWMALLKIPAPSWCLCSVLFCGDVFHNTTVILLLYFYSFSPLPVLCPVGISHAWCMTDTWYVEELSMPPGTV